MYLLKMVLNQAIDSPLILIMEKKLTALTLFNTKLILEKGIKTH